MERAESLLSMVDVGKKQSFLEVGCGNGAVSRFVAGKFPLEVTGVDIDPEMIRWAREKASNMPNIRFLEADATSLPFPDGDFDIVLSFGVMHHISGWLEALAEIGRVLKSGGYFVYADLIYGKRLARIAKSFRHSYGVTNMHDLENFIQQNKFSTIYASMKNDVVWHNCEAVYRKN